jgi:hypothetical protein
MLQETMTTVRTNRIAVLLVALFSLWVIAYGGFKQTPLLMPLLGATLYGLWPYRVMNNRTIIGFILVLCAVIAGMVLGPLQSSDWANHLSHMLVASLLAFGVLLEFRGRATNLMVGFATLGVVVTCGVGMEIAEAVVHWNDTFGRYHDTMLDLGADLGGALLGILIGWQLSQAGLTGKDNMRGGLQLDNDNRDDV